VTSFQDITPPEIPQPTTTDYATAWLSQNWTTVGMILLAGIAMLMLRSMVRSVSVAGSSAANVVAARIEGHGQAPQAEQEAPANEPRLRRFIGKGPSLRDELSQMVQSDPDAAANVLRTWIGSGVPQGKS
jgi:flagellar M-ring protein FliF